MSAQMPDFAGFRRIIQSAGGSITMFYDTGQGQGWQRNIVMNGTPHLPSSIRQWHGDSRGRWEGNTLVVDVTNFSPKTSYQNSRENLHLTERWTRLDANTLGYSVTFEDPTTWTKPWTKQELISSPMRRTDLTTEPRCFEGNMGFPECCSASVSRSWRSPKVVSGSATGSVHRLLWASKIRAA